jgi:hypothetical protein
MKYGGALVAVESGGKLRKVCRVFFGRDGSYYVTAPYHRIREAALVKATVNFKSGEQWVEWGDTIQLAALHDEEGRLKLSHHPSGLVQFSGSGIVSGVAADGSIRGVGIQSWRLEAPARGPSFTLVVAGIDQLDEATGSEPDLLVFRTDETGLLSTWGVLVLEGQYFPPLWRRFIRPSLSAPGMTIRVVHPAQAVLDLRVVSATDECELPGFIGLEVYGYDDNGGPVPRFVLNGPTGNVRPDETGEMVGDQISAAFPRGIMPTRSSANY